MKKDILQATYLSDVEKTSRETKTYTQTMQSLCRYLAYRDLPHLIQKHINGNRVLDYGAGTGLSTQFLVEEGFEVKGVDVSKEMLMRAKDHCSSTQFFLIKNGSTPFETATFDFVFSSFVLFEIGKLNEIISYLNEARRILKKNGILIVITGSPKMYFGDWLVMKTDFPENKKPKSGDRVKIHLPDVDIEFTDYYWSDADYTKVFKETKFRTKEIHYPLGKKEEPWPWKDELHQSPFAIYVTQPDQT